MNVARLASLVANSADQGARLVALTEMYATGFSMAAERIAEAPDGPSTAFLVAQARQHHLWVCASVPTRSADDARPTNRFLLAAPDGSTQYYDKLHPFSFAGEHEHYAAGADTITFDVEGVRVTPFICYDLRFGDDWWARAADTDLYVCVANWPAARRVHWQTLLLARAIENQAYVVGANRVGSGGGSDYVGDSVIIGPFGEVLASATEGVEQVIVADIDPARVREVRESFPFMRDRRSYATD